MKPQIKTAIVMAAGSGTRRLPITRAIDKAMLPIGNRPTIDYVVEQCAHAGIERIVCVITNEDSLIKKYYNNAIDVATEYPWLGLKGTISVTYVVQDQSKYGYGSGSAVACTEDAFDDERFVVAAADGFIYNSDKPVIKAIVEGYQKDSDKSAGAVIGLAMPDYEIAAYSLIKQSEDRQLEELIEKPVLDVTGQAVLANVSYYVLSRDVFDLIRHLAMHNNEYYLTDAVLDLAQQKGVTVVPVEGVYLDSGRQEAWLGANRHIIDV